MLLACDDAARANLSLIEVARLSSTERAAADDPLIEQEGSERYRADPNLDGPRPRLINPSMRPETKSANVSPIATVMSARPSSASA